MPDPNTRHMHRPRNRGRQEDPSERTTRPRTRPGEPASRMPTVQRPQGANVRPSALRDDERRGSGAPSPGVARTTVGAADFGLYGSPTFPTARPESSLIEEVSAVWSHRTPAWVPCGWCGRRVPERVSGRRRRWCSDSCRMKSYRAHRRLAVSGRVRKGSVTQW